EPRISRTIRSDFSQTKIKEEFKAEYKDLKQYFLTEERKKKLESMYVLKKFFILPWWLLKALYFRLTPFRRLLLVFGIIFILISGNSQLNEENFNVDLNASAIFGCMIILFILGLELKDKILARTELEEGRAIQQALMPERSPKIHGWDIWLFTRSANDVGGYLLDFIKLGDNKYGVAVGDVAGKGLSAALLMAKLQSTIRALAYDFPSLASLGNKLNKIFNRDSLPKIFASLIYAEIRSDSNDIKFINAGHYPPIIIQKDRTEQLKKDAPALGLLADSKFTEQMISLTQNEFMIIYSDGLTEAQNESGKFFGESRLLELTKNNQSKSSAQLGEYILSNVDLFIGKTPAHDDLTLAVLKRNV
ncbi:MAG: PP2C family protein-serine/threonine phosphatase, partial [Ignavibacteriaceae bacterium]